MHISHAAVWCGLPADRTSKSRRERSIVPLAASPSIISKNLPSIAEITLKFSYVTAMR